MSQAFDFLLDHLFPTVLNMCIFSKDDSTERLPFGPMEIGPADAVTPNSTLYVIFLLSSVGIPYIFLGANATTAGSP